MMLSAVLCLFLLYFVYRLSDSQRYGKITALSMLFGNLAIAVTTVQSVNIVLSLFPIVPEELRWIKTITEVFMLRLTELFPNCGLGTSFGARFAFAAPALRCRHRSCRRAAVWSRWRMAVLTSASMRTPPTRT